MKRSAKLANELSIDKAYLAEFRAVRRKDWDEYSFYQAMSMEPFLCALRARIRHMRRPSVEYRLFRVLRRVLAYTWNIFPRPPDPLAMSRHVRHFKNMPYRRKLRQRKLRSKQARKHLRRQPVFIVSDSARLTTFPSQKLLPEESSPQALEWTAKPLPPMVLPDVEPNLANIGLALAQDSRIHITLENDTRFAMDGVPLTSYRTVWRVRVKWKQGKKTYRAVASQRRLIDSIGELIPKVQEAYLRALLMSIYVQYKPTV